MQFDYRGTQVRQSQPVRKLVHLTKTLTVDSNDRDTTLFVRVNGGATSSDAGDYTVYLPRVYEKVTKITLKSAIIQAPTAGFQSTDMYVLMGLEGLNRKDETAPGADRSGYVDSWFAKIPNDKTVTTGATISQAQSSGTAVTYTTSLNHSFYTGQTVNITGLTGNGVTANLGPVTIASVPSATTFTVTSTVSFNGNSAVTGQSGSAIVAATLFFNDQTYDTQSVSYQPPIGRLNRLHITLRRHLPFSSIGTTTPLTAPITFGSAQNSFTFEIEYLDNVFDDFASVQTFLDVPEGGVSR